MMVKSSKVFEKCLFFSKTTGKRNVITLFSSILCKYRIRYSSYESSSCIVLLQNTLPLKFRQCCMFQWFSLGTVYQTMSSSLNDIMASAAQTDSFTLIKKKSVTSNVNQPERSETSKITKVITSAPYTPNTQILSSGTNWFTKEKER